MTKSFLILYTSDISHEPVPSENDEPLLNISAPVVREGTLPTVVSEEVRKMLQVAQLFQRATDTNLFVTDSSNTNSRR